ncbi:hypothetical protein AAD018_007935 [Aestuariibius insulae]|uniref:hypothetical protein n=1 Tax=Aestuariibius insulae TaxID=2058287 RepID=UPI00345E906B
MKIKNQGFIALLLLALLLGWIVVALVWPWLMRTFSEPSISGLIAPLSTLT